MHWNRFPPSGTRRGVALGLAVVVCLASLAATAGAQPAGPVRVGMLPLGSPASEYDRSLVEAFRGGLREVGLVENRHIVLDVAWVDGEAGAARAVAELVQRGAKLLVPCGTSASLAAKRGAGDLPVLFISVGNPVGIGLAQTLALPGGNASGFSDALAELGGKLVQLAKELGKPDGSVHYLWHDGWADGPFRFHMTERAARSAGVKLRPRAARGPARRAAGEVRAGDQPGHGAGARPHRSAVAASAGLRGRAVMGRSVPGFTIAGAVASRERDS